MKNKILFLLIFMLASLIAVAQHVSGIVRSNTGERIGFARIQFINLGIDITCNDEGEYSTEVPLGKHQVTAQAIGFAVANKIAGIKEGDNLLDFILLPITEALNDDIITAGRSLHTIQSIPLAVTVLDQQKISDAQVWRLADLSTLAPNFYSANQLSSARYNMIIRGVLNLSARPSVATILDDAFIINPVCNGFPIVDIERIEIINGPQGVLYGQNASGGVANIISKRPDNRRQATATGSVDFLGQKRGHISFKSPLISNKLFLSINGLGQYQPAWLKNDLTGTQAENSPANGQLIGDESTKYGDINLIWKPSNRLEFYLKSRYMDEHSDVSGIVLEKARQLGDDPDDFPRFNRLPEYNRKVSNSTLKISYLFPKCSVNAISNWQYAAEGYTKRDQDSNPREQFWDATWQEKEGNPNPTSVLLQELNISTIDHSRIFYFKAGVQAFHAQREGGTKFHTQYGGPQEPDSLYPRHVIQLEKSQNRQVSAYTQAGISLWRYLHIKAGIRVLIHQYNYEAFYHKYIRDKFFSSPGYMPVPQIYRTWAPQFDISYQLPYDHLIYGSYSTGPANVSYYKGPVSSQYKPFHKAIDIGYKYMSVNKRFYVQGNVFHTRSFSEIPNFNSEPVPRKITSTTGGELVFAIKPYRRLSTDLQVSLCKTRFIEYEYSGINGYSAPLRSFYWSIRYDIPLNSKLNVVIRPEIRRWGPQRADGWDNQQTQTMLNIRFGIAAKHFECFFWGRNFLDNQLYEYHPYNNVIPPQAGAVMGLTLSGKI